MKNNNLILIGKVIGFFGIKGEMKVYSESDFISDRFKVGAKIIFKMNNMNIEAEVTSFRIHKKMILITIDHINDINMVLKYNGQNIYAKGTDEITLKEDEYYLDDLIGLKVLDENNNSIGVVNDFLEVPQGSLLEIKNQKTFLVPFVKEYILEIKLSEYIKIKVIDYESAL